MPAPDSLAPNVRNRCLAQWEYAHGTADVRSVPAEMQIALTNDCNFHCAYCIDHYVGSPAPRTRLAGETRGRMLDLLPRISALAFHGISEFMIDPEFFSILSRCADAGVTLLVNTNGSVCTKKHLDALCDYPADLRMNFSLDAASAESFRIMRGWDFERVLANVETFVRELRARRRRATGLQCSFVIARCNLHEVCDFLRLAKRLGVDSVNCHPLHEYPGLNWIAPVPGGGSFDYRDQLPSNEPERFNEQIARARVVAADLGIEVELPAPYPLARSA